MTLFIGATVTNVRYLTDEEKELEGWEDSGHTPVAIEFDNGLLIYASQDDEGNGPGSMFAVQTLDVEGCVAEECEGHSFYVSPDDEHEDA